jgi:uncharacterized protein (DUF362 family)
MSTHNRISRRDFLIKAGLAGAGLYLSGCAAEQSVVLATPAARSSLPTLSSLQETPDIQETHSVYGDVALCAARGGDIPEMVRRAVAALGGMPNFVQPGMDVVIKPNICTDYYPSQYAATTNPIVVGTLVSLAFAAGAARVRVMDNPFGGTPQSAYRVSGIEEAVRAAGGEMEVMNPNKFRMADIPEGVDIRQWEIYQDILNADALINVPIAKHHGTTALTLGAKNLMGTILHRGRMHANLHQRIADLASRVRPALTVMDAVRTLMRNGPTGGNLDDVRQTDTVIASADLVAADSYAATLFGLSGADIGYIQAGADLGMGTLHLEDIKVEEINV